MSKNISTKISCFHKDAIQTILVISLNASQSCGLWVPSQPTLPNSYSNTSCSSWGESGLMEASKLHYVVSHVRLSSVLSICGERRKEQKRGWSRGNQR